jgi:hypothetical protein
MCSVTTPSTPLTGLGWPVSRETPEGNVSRETGLTGLGWPEGQYGVPAHEAPQGDAR